MTTRILNSINGEWAEPVSGGYLPNREPATGEVYSEFPDSDARDIERAVDAAARAFPTWAATPAAERSRLMLAVADAIDANHEKLAQAESRDTGKPITAARNVDIPRAAANFRFFATAILHTQSETHQTDNRALNMTLRQPRGVAACISPWNLPLYLFTWKIAPALATGNTVVGKPSELTPMTAYLLAKICHEVGFPAGVLNIVHGTGKGAGAPLVAHSRVPAISFTGGTATGAEIGQVAAAQFKKVSLELGGKNPTLVFADTDLDEAVPEAVRAAFSNTGQICLCGSRVLVEDSIYPEFIERFVAETAAWVPGDPAQAKTRVGALISAEHREKVRGYVKLAREEGGTVVAGGGDPADLPDRVRGGYFLEPTVITGLGPGCRVFSEEIFGPVATVTSFSGEHEALEMANATPYGLAASVWTRDLDRAHRVAGRLDSGVVWVNCWMLRDLRTPFGGMKQSGVGREGGTQALNFFTESKNVCIRLKP